MSVPPARPALVTGASGFIGRHLVATLAGRGWRPVGLVSPQSDGAPHAGVPVIRADIRDGTAIHAAVSGVRPDTVFHLAAQSSAPVSMRDPVTDIEVNVVGTVHLVQAAVAAGVRRFVFFSTGAAMYGGSGIGSVDERTPVSPDSVYGISKRAAERYLQLVGAGSGLELSVLRLGSVHGPGQYPERSASAVPAFAARMFRGEPVTIFGDGSQVRDYVYVEDVVEAALLAATEAPALCLVGSGVATTISQLFETLARLCAYSQKPVFAPPRPGDAPGVALRPALARELWGWEPRVSFDDGMAATVDWLRQAAAG